MTDNKGIISRDKRYVLFPLKHPDLWAAYKDQQASFWTAEEIDMTEDMNHYREKLNDGERRLLARVLGYFAPSDTIVAENLEDNFIDECRTRGWLEGVYVYEYQAMMENVHSEAYSIMIERLISDRKERQELFNAIYNVDSIKEKAGWCLKWMGTGGRFDQLDESIQGDLQALISDKQDVSAGLQAWMDSKPPTFGERLVAFVCVEAIFFSASFAVIFWFKKRGLLPGICFANELIARDEGMHHSFGALLKKKLEDLVHDPDPKLAQLGEIVPKERVLEIVKSCVVIEQQFIRDCLPLALAGINEDKMCKYAEYVADRALLDMGCERYYYAGINNPKNPCDWMERIGLHHKTNFFEGRVSSYQRRGVKQTQHGVELNVYRTDVDF